jgi:hypothetical protein
VVTAQPPQQAMQDYEAQGIAVQDRRLRQLDELRWHIEGAVRRWRV